ncbi:hypothetical protein [Ruegeria arenilitoris]|uniref:hypothetical protein n=1 Tax=Ruegeria arenilitoris TaxID=1173585 RepID=UPI00147DD8D1|nr:hypothetical protein [Ruegeria arenilitoris]
MLITGKRIIDEKLLTDAVEKSIRSGSYYLRIHCIIPAGDDAKDYDPGNPLTSYTLKPGGLAYVVSEEAFSITDYKVTALVTLRSGFTKQGMLALDVGLVDANYSGPIGTIVINFSKNDIHLRKDMEFFRVVFFEHAEIEEAYRYPVIANDHQKYIGERLGQLINGFPETFLRTGETEEKVKEAVTKRVLEELKPTISGKLLNYIFSNHKKTVVFVTIAILLATSALSLLGMWIFGFVVSPDGIAEMLCEYGQEQLPDGIQISEEFCKKE